MIETMWQTLIQIPGPAFLWYFAGLSVICIVLAWLWARADGSTQYPLPELTRFDPVAIAALRGGTNSVIRTIIFSLWKRNLVEIRDDGKETEITTLKHWTDAKLEPVEKEIYQALQVPTKAGDLFQDKNLLLNLEIYLGPIYEKLENLHLARTENERSRIWWIFGSFLLVIVGVGGTKLYLGLIYGHPVFFLIILLFVSVIVLYTVLDPKAIPTASGGSTFKGLRSTLAGSGNRSKKLALRKALIRLSPLLSLGSGSWDLQLFTNHSIKLSPHIKQDREDVAVDVVVEDAAEVAVGDAEVVEDAVDKATAQTHRYPQRLLLQWHITERCNLRCAHCYQETYSGKELEFRELLYVLGSSRISSV